MTHYPGDARIVITGIGPVSPLGIGKEAVLAGLSGKGHGLVLRESRLASEIWDSSYIYTVKDFDINDFGIDEDDLKYIRNWKEGEDNKDLLFMLAAVKLAVQDSKIDYRNRENNLSLVVTHENPGLEQCLRKTYQTAFDLYKGKRNLPERDFYEEIFRKTLKAGYETQSFMTLFHIARTFHVKNYSLFVNNACASGLYAIESAADLIRLGKSPQVIVAAGDCPDVFKTIWLKSIDMYQDDGKIRPFDKNAKGFVLGEGAAALVLEEYGHAQGRGAHIYADYLGGGFRLEGWGVTTPMIGGKSYHEAIKEALATSGVSNKEIQLICGHGVGTPSCDYYEAKAITDIFPGLDVPVTALKPYVGHNLGGSALLELAVLLLSLERRIVPAILNTDDPNPALGLNLVLDSRDRRPADINFFMKLCCAFAGYNAATVFRRE